MTSFTLRDGVVAAAIAGIVALGLLLRVGASVGGTLVAGEVIAKHEAVTMPLDDTWRHTFEVSYRYRPLDAAGPLTGRHPVDVTLFDRLHVGSPVGVLYRRLPFLGAWFGPESALADASWWSRAAVSSESARELGELLAFALSGLLWFLAYRLNSRALGLVAATVCAAAASAVLLLGFVVFPLLFWMWCGHPGKGFGWVLLASTGLAAAGLYYRVPWPAPLPDGPRHAAVAQIRAIRVVDRIWASSSTSDESTRGQPIVQPFQMVDLEFVPTGWSEAVHAVDLVDMGSVPKMRVGTTIPIIYSDADPRAGRISAGTRNFGRQAAIYLFGLTYGIGAAIALSVLAVLLVIRRLVRMLRRRLAVPNIAARDSLLSGLPRDDPRRKTIERLRQLLDGTPRA